MSQNNNTSIIIDFKTYFGAQLWIWDQHNLLTICVVYSVITTSEIYEEGNILVCQVEQVIVYSFSEDLLV